MQQRGSAEVTLMSYEQVEDLPPAEFKRYCGVQPQTFHKMVEIISTHLNKMRRVSRRPTKLSVEDQVLTTLEYWREYGNANQSPAWTEAFDEHRLTNHVSSVQPVKPAGVCQLVRPYGGHNFHGVGERG